MAIREVSDPHPSIEVQVDGVARPGGWDAVESELGLFAVEHLTHLVAIHAALIDVDGCGVLLPGSSFAGKSTLAEAFARAGASVKTDEFALVDPTTGLAHGWPRPMVLRRPGGVRERVPVATDAETPIEVDLVAAVRYAPEADPHLQSVSASETVVALLAHTIPARRDPQRATDAALALARRARGVVGTRGEAGHAVAMLRECLRESVPT